MWFLKGADYLTAVHEIQGSCPPWIVVRLVQKLLQYVALGAGCTPLTTL